jgi:tetratricopeptide (TPR) repeat protein
MTIFPKSILVFVSLVGTAILPMALYAADLAPEQKLQSCLKKAHDLPDDAAADAEAWEKQGGGGRALYCEATAQLERGEYATAAQEFMTLAVAESKSDPKHAASFYAQAGLAYTTASDDKNAEIEYGNALKLEPQDPDIWLDRATERASGERYMDAIDDINKALILMPDMGEAYRMRGQVYIKLGLDSNAAYDFAKAEDLDAEDQTLSKTPPPANKK